MLVSHGCFRSAPAKPVAGGRAERKARCGKRLDGINRICRLAVRFLMLVGRQGIPAAACQSIRYDQSLRRRPVVAGSSIRFQVFHGPIESSQFRHFGPHRLGQDDPQRADPLLLRPHPQDGRGQGGRRRRDHGPHGAGERARHHDHQRRHAPGVEGADEGSRRRADRHAHEPDRHARPRRFHDRGRAQPARAGRGDPRALRRRRRAVAVDDRRSPDEAVSHSAAGVHQQDGPHRRSAVRDRRGREGEARRRLLPDAVSDGRRRELRRHDRPGHAEGHVLRRQRRREGPLRAESRPSMPPR